jgi:hypothetical protein
MTSYIIEQIPVVFEIGLKALAIKQIAELALEVGIIRFVVEAKRAAVVDIVRELDCHGVKDAQDRGLRELCVHLCVKKEQSSKTRDGVEKTKTK